MPAALLVAVVGVLAGLGGCLPARIGGDRSLEESANELRRSNLELRRDNERLSTENQDLVEAIRELEARLADPPALPEVEPQRLPRLTRLGIGRYSGAIDTTRDGRDDTLRLYLETRDQDGRFLVVAAVARISAVMVPMAADEDEPSPIALGSRSFSAEEFARAYRSGLTGTHYTLEMPIDHERIKHIPAEHRPELITLQVELTEAATGQRLTRQMPVRVRWSARSSGESGEP
ncbi:MAG: hypothetical protein JJU36_00315 [Phycisphaeraceae bacterium]|nr:hypothetical protein [Phycisphaeraceae bacterium]